MQRLARKPSTIWLLLVALLVTSGVLTAIRGLGGFANAATCTGYGYGYGYGYNSPAPQLTLGLSVSSPVAGAPVTVSGTFTQNGCALPGETVTILRRAVVNGVATGSSVTFRTATTDANGAYSITLGEAYNAEYKAMVAASNGRPAANSPARVIIVHAKLLVQIPPGPASQLQVVSGAVKPNRRGSIITLYRFDSAGHRIPVAHQTIYSANVFYFKVKLGRGYSKLVLILGTSSTSQFGYATVFAHRS